MLPVCMLICKPDTMKKTVLTLIVTIVTVIGLHAFRMQQSEGIKGTILPADAASIIYAIQGKDSVMALPGREGFFMHVKKGMWTVYIKANPPYKDVIIQEIKVQENEVKVLGEITMQK